MQKNNPVMCQFGFFFFIHISETTAQIYFFRSFYVYPCIQIGPQRSKSFWSVSTGLLVVNISVKVENKVKLKTNCFHVAISAIICTFRFSLMSKF